MSATTLGLLTGLVLGVTVAFGGFGAFVIVLLLGAVGLGVGRYLDGQLDLSSLRAGRDRGLR